MEWCDVCQAHHVLMPHNEQDDKAPAAPKPVPPAIQRLLDEVRPDAGGAAYDRGHNRHNRS